MDLDVHLPGIVSGDADAFARWLAGAEAPVRRALRSFAAAVDVEAVLQEALLRVWQTAPRLSPDGRPNTLLRFAVRVARNAAIDEARRVRPTADLDALERAGAEVETPALPDPLLRRAIERCRDALPSAPRAAFDARSGGGRPDRALAEELHMQLNTFLKNVGRARALLLACLERAGIRMEVT
ncbi:MAG: RNA polymerase sigma factor [Myxococcota bacterium]